MAATAPNYRQAPGMDRCDNCFSRADDGLACKLHGSLGDTYRPNKLCDDYAQRSCSQRFDADGKVIEGETVKIAEVDQFGQTINGVHIFKTGTWNGKKYSTRDLDDMVKAAKEMGYKPPVTLGHDAGADAPAYGFVDNVRREGDVLLADFTDVPDDLVAQIKDRRYDQVSSEIFFDLKRDGKTFRRALRAVAVIGAHPPGVSDLKPLSELLAQFSAADHYETITKETSDMAGDDTHAAEIAKLTADLAAAQATIKAAQDEAEALKNKAPAADMQLTIQKLTERLERAELAAVNTAERERQGRIKALTDALQRPPYRRYVQALAELATAGDKPGAEPVKVNFQAAGAEQAAPTTAFGVLEDFVRVINQDVSLLLTEQMKHGTFERTATSLDDPASEINALTQAYMRANPAVDVDKARHFVIGDPKNAEVVRRWNSATSLAN